MPLRVIYLVLFTFAESFALPPFLGALDVGAVVLTLS